MNVWKSDQKKSELEGEPEDDEHQDQYGQSLGVLTVAVHVPGVDDIRQRLFLIIYSSTLMFGNGENLIITEKYEHTCREKQHTREEKVNSRMDLPKPTFRF